jgi:benzoate membrane transport protein
VGALVGIALPLAIVTMAAQNVPGLAVLRQYGYRPPLRPILLGTGLSTALGSVTGVYTVNLAAITAALAASAEAHPDPRRRWIASTSAGTCYLLLGLASGAATTLLSVAPPLLIEAIAGLALLPALGAALAAATADPEYREAAVLTLAVGASGVAPLTIGAPFWALLVGLGHLALRHRRTRRATGDTAALPGEPGGAAATTDEVAQQA